MGTIKKIVIAILLTILASSAYANLGVTFSLSPGYSNYCNQLVWVDPVYYNNGTWTPGHYVTVNTCYYNNPGFYYGYRYGGWHHGGGHHGNSGFHGNWGHGGSGHHSGGHHGGGGHHR